METTPFTEEAAYVPGIGYNKRIAEFAFANAVNSVGESYKIQNGHVVFKVSEVINAGVKKFDEVKEYVKSLVIREKKFAKASEIAKDIKNKVNGDLSKANSVNGLATYANTGNFTAAGSVPQVGKDYSFIDNALTIEKGKVSDPIKGQRGVFLIKVVQRTDFDKSAYQMQRNSLRDNVLQEKKGTYFSQWLAKLKKDSKIVDNRHMFFGR